MNLRRLMPNHAILAMLVPLSIGVVGLMTPALGESVESRGSLSTKRKRSGALITSRIQSCEFHRTFRRCQLARMLIGRETRPDGRIESSRRSLDER